MVHLEIDVTPTGYVLHLVTCVGSEMLGRFDSDDQSLVMLLATLRKRLEDGVVSRIVFAEGHDPDLALLLLDAIDMNNDGGRPLRDLAMEISYSGGREAHV